MSVENGGNPERDRVMELAGKLAGLEMDGFVAEQLAGIISDALDAIYQRGVDNGLTMTLDGVEVDSLAELRRLVERGRRPTVDVIEHDRDANELVLYCSRPYDPRVGGREYRSYRVGNGAATISLVPLHEGQR